MGLANHHESFTTSNRKCPITGIKHPSAGRRLISFAGSPLPLPFNINYSFLGQVGNSVGDVFFDQTTSQPFSMYTSSGSINFLEKFHLKLLPGDNFLSPRQRSWGRGLWRQPSGCPGRLPNSFSGACECGFWRSWPLNYSSTYTPFWGL